MKLRKLFATAAMALCVGASAYAVNPDEVRIYINPGHGSWGPNNRHMATIGHNPINSQNPDTTDFYESNTNLHKGLEMLHRLVDYGMPFDKTKNQENSNPNRIGAALDLTQNVVMSRVKSGPYPYETINGVDPDQNNDFNRTLTEIAAEVENNDFDLFVSIHSNANVDGDGINYLYFIYRTNYGAPEDKSVEVSQKCWNHRILDRHTQWSHYDYQVPAGGAGKIASGNYIVLAHSVPGYLVEGYFHTYQPSRHRYMNFDMCRLEGIDYARGIADYFGWEKESTGDICGVVRDKHTKFSDALYNPKGGTKDVYKPLNGVEVTLKKDGEVVSTYTTDVNYNGLFAFRNLVPGDYTVEFSHPEYKDAMVWTSEKASEKATKSLAVTVKAATTTYPTAFIEDVNYVAPAITYVNYPDSTAGKTGFNLFPNYDVKVSEINLLADQLAGKTVRRQIVRNGKLYVLALDAANEPYIYLADLAAGTVVELDKAAVTESANSRLKISDIALTADHVLVATGMTVTYSDASRVQGSDVFNGVLNAYKWTKNAETGLPETCEKWFETSYYCNWYRCLLGQTITYSGTLAEGNMILTGQSATATTLRIAKFGISEGAKISEMRFNGANDKTNFCVDVYTDNNMYELAVSPLNPDNYVFDGNKTAPMEFTGSGDNATPQVLGRNPLVNVKANGANYFKFAGKSLMVSPAVNEEGEVVGIELYDITNGFDNAKAIELKGATIEPTRCTYASAHGELALTLNSSDITTGASLVLYLVVDGKTYKFVEFENFVSKTATAGAPNPFAYALKSEVVDGVLNATFSLNTAANEVLVNVRNADGERMAFANGSTDKGTQTVKVDLNGLPYDTYTWEVEVAGDLKTEIEHYGNYSFWHPRGVEVDNNMESPSFGNIYVAEGQLTTNSAYWSGTGGGLGLYAFDAGFNPIKNTHTGKYSFTGGWTLHHKAGTAAAADFSRVRVAEDGRIFLSRLNDKGDYILYANSFEELAENNTLHSLFTGYTFDASTYKYFDANGGYMGSANLALSVKGSGDDLKILSLGSNNLHWSYVFSGVSCDEYSLGTATTVSAPATIAALTGQYTIAPSTTSLDYDDRGGIWWCQYRGNPTNAEPSLIYVAADGSIKYFEGAGGRVRGGGGVRVSPNGEQVAIASSKTQFTIYDIVWAEDGTPVLRRKYEITHGIGTNCYDIAWDIAGNIYAVSNSGELVRGFALPREEAFTTKAASKYTFTIDDPTVIERVDADENAPVEYYNLQGVKVENPSNGIFIRKQGRKATKVVL